MPLKKQLTGRERYYFKKMSPLHLFMWIHLLTDEGLSEGDARNCVKIKHLSNIVCDDSDNGSDMVLKPLLMDLTGWTFSNCNIRNFIFANVIRRFTAMKCNLPPCVNSLYLKSSIIDCTLELQKSTIFIQTTFTRVLFRGLCGVKFIKCTFVDCIFIGDTYNYSRVVYEGRQVVINCFSKKDIYVFQILRYITLHPVEEKTTELPIVCSPIRYDNINPSGCWRLQSYAEPGERTHISIGCKKCGVHILNTLPNGRRVFACDVCTRKYGIIVRATGNMSYDLVRKIMDLV